MLFIRVVAKNISFSKDLEHLFVVFFVKLLKMLIIINVVT